MPNLPASPTIQVAFVEDDPQIAEALATAIRAAEGLQLHGVARSVREARAMLRLPAAQVLVVDLGLPDGSGVEVIRAAQAAWPDCAVVVSTSFGDEAHVMQSLEAGATGYLLKDSSPRHIVEEIRAAQAGGSPISPLIARQLLTRFKQAGTPPSPAAGVPAAEQAQLSPRERQVLEYITKGFSYEEIAGLMDVTRNTVLSFVRRIYAKLEVRSQVEAIHEARSQGLLAP
ncbi:response regulator transcription factor [Variovorax boronicumulans]|uniref:response regulator transcription factor n=1 Tax=Variovorax boronicumulans TaxID=436515 RepID=UPI0033960016